MISSSVAMPSESGQKLLITTQKVDQNDTDLGFFHEWLKVFARSCDRVTVLTLYKGAYELPSNVRVISLGKEEGVSRIQYLTRFYKTIWQYRKDYDGVFVHMNPIYVVLGGLYWRLVGKRIVLWYTHRNVDLKLRIATLLSHKIFTASIHGMQINTKKKEIIGHGINVDYFSCSPRKEKEEFTILHVGRITEIKNCDTIVRAIALASFKIQKPLKMIFIGDTVTKEDEIILKDLKELAISLGIQKNIIWHGGVPYRELTTWYCRADLTINATPTGGVDKAVLESFSCGVPALVSNETFAPLFANKKDILVYHLRDENDLSQKIIYFAGLSSSQRYEEIKNVSETIRTTYNLRTFIQKITSHGF